MNCRPLNVPSKKSSYMALLSSPVEQGHPDNLEYPPAEGNGSRDRPSGPTSGDDESEGTFQFKPLSDAGMASSSADESTDKGHSRSTSLDLNKMFMGSAKPGDGVCVVLLYVMYWRLGRDNPFNIDWVPPFECTPTYTCCVCISISNCYSKYFIL